MAHAMRKAAPTMAETMHEVTIALEVMTTVPIEGGGTNGRGGGGSGAASGGEAMLEAGARRARCLCSQQPAQGVARRAGGPQAARLVRSVVAKRKAPEALAMLLNIMQQRAELELTAGESLQRGI